MAPNVGLLSAQEMMRQIINKASQLFYGGGKPTVFGMKMEPLIMLEAGLGVNGSLSPTAGGGMGVIATQGFLDLGNQVARDFAIGHELGHGFGEKILPEMGLGGISGSGTEVIADLTSAHILNQLGISWDRIFSALSSAQGQIFDTTQSGDHPPAVQRIGNIKSMMLYLSQGLSFHDSAKTVLGAIQ